MVEDVQNCLLYKLEDQMELLFAAEALDEVDNVGVVDHFETADLPSSNFLDGFVFVGFLELLDRHYVLRFRGRPRGG